MLKLLFKASRIAGLTYQTMATSVMIFALAHGVYEHLRGGKRR